MGDEKDIETQRLALNEKESERGYRLAVLKLAVEHLSGGDMPSLAKSTAALVAFVLDGTPIPAQD